MRMRRGPLDTLERPRVGAEGDRHAGLGQPRYVGLRELERVPVRLGSPERPHPRLPLGVAQRHDLRRIDIRHEERVVEEGRTVPVGEGGHLAGERRHVARGCRARSLPWPDRQSARWLTASPSPSDVTSGPPAAPLCSTRPASMPSSRSSARSSTPTESAGGGLLRCASVSQTASTTDRLVTSASASSGAPSKNTCASREVRCRV